MQSNSALDAVLAQAEEAALAFVPPTTSLVPVQVPVAANNNALVRPTMAGLADSAGGMVVDEYLTMVYEGFKIGGLMKGLIDDFVGEIDMADCIPVYTSRHTVAGTTSFVKSYDGQMTPQGQNFQQEVGRLNAQPGSMTSGVYLTVEIPVTLTADVADPKKDATLVIHEGSRVGVTLPKTGVKEFVKFQNDLAKRGLNPETAVVKVKLSHVPIEHKQNKWAVVAFELLDEAE